MRIILGSQSAFRRALAEQLADNIELMSADIDEKAIRSGDYEELPLLLAHAKADALLPRIDGEALLITSDQVVVWRDELREKPESREQAAEYLRSYSVHPAQTNTAVVVTNTATGKRYEGLDIAKAWYRPIPEEVIEQLLDEDKVTSAAGGFRIEDPLLKRYLERFEGAMDSVMGLPLDLTRSLLGRARESS